MKNEFELSLSAVSKTRKVQEAIEFMPYDKLAGDGLAFAEYILEQTVDDSPKGGADALFASLLNGIGGMNQYLNFGILTSLADVTGTPCPSRNIAMVRRAEWTKLKGEERDDEIANRQYNRGLLTMSADDLVIRRDGQDFLLTWNSGILRNPGPNKVNGVTFEDFTTPADTNYITSNYAPYTQYVDRMNKLFGVDFRRSRTHTRPHSIEIPLGADLQTMFGIAPNMPDQSTALNGTLVNWHKKHCTLRLTVKVRQSAVGISQKLEKGTRPPYTEEAFIDGSMSNDFIVAHSLYFEVIPSIKVPRSFAVYASQAENPKLFSLVQYFRDWTKDQIVEQKYKGFDPSQTLESVSNLAARKKALGAYVQQDRASADGVVSSIEGDFQWVPVDTEAARNNVLAYEETIESLYEYLSVIGSPANMTRSTQDQLAVANTPEMAEFLNENSIKRENAISRIRQLSCVPMVSNWDLNINVSINEITGGIRVTPLYGSSAPSDAALNHIVSGVAADGLSQAWKRLSTPTGQSLHGDDLDPDTYSPMLSLHVHNMLGRMGAAAFLMGQVKGLEEYLKEARESYDPKINLGEAAAYRVAFGQRSNAGWIDEGMTVLPFPNISDILRDVAGSAGQKIAGGGLSKMYDGKKLDSKAEARWTAAFYRASQYQALSLMFLSTVGVLNAAAHLSTWRRMAQGDPVTEDQMDELWTRRRQDPLSSMSDIHKLVIGRAFIAFSKDLMAAINKGDMFQLDKVAELYDDETCFMPSISDVRTQVMPYLYVWTRVIAEAQQISTAAQERQAKLLKARENKEIPKFALGTDNSFSLMQHQARKMGQLSVAPKTDWSDISPGGGKGTITILDAVNLITNHQVKRALVLCPNDLILNYTRDLQKYAKSNWNIIALNTQVFNEWGEERLEAMINGAPINTIVVAGFDWMARAGRSTVKVGTEVIDFYTALEFMRQFAWQAILIDEVHFLRNNSQRNQVVTALVQDPRVEYVRKLSGTLVVDTVTNVLYEARIDDPGLYGSEEDFTRRYMPTGALTSESIGEVKKVLERNTSYFRATKKDWAFCLPLPRYEFVPVQMNEQMRELYDKAVAQVMINLEALAKDNVAIRKALDRLAKEIPGEVDDSETEGAMALIATHLQSLERLVVDPMGDPNVEQFKGVDFKSPVWDAVVKRLDTHFETSKNKVIIVCRYRRNAAAVLKNLGKYRKVAMYYDASVKENRSEFENNPDLKVLVAVEQSIVNGFNLQMGDMIIRIDAPWSPGDLEQAESRIFRPDVENRFGRDYVYIVWIVVDGSLQTAKAARLVSKMINKAKFDEYGDPRYDAIPTLPLIKMNLGTFQRSKNLTDYEEYLNAFGHMIKVVGEDFLAAKKAANENPGGFWTPVQGSPLLEGSRAIITPLVSDGAVPDPFGHTYIDLNKYAYDEQERLIERQYVGMPVRAPMGYGTIADVKYGVDEAGNDFINSVKIRYSSMLDEYGRPEEVRYMYRDFSRVFVGTTVDSMGKLLYTVPHTELVVDSTDPDAALAKLESLSKKKKVVRKVEPKEEIEEQIAPEPVPKAKAAKQKAETNPDLPATDKAKAPVKKAKPAPKETEPMHLNSDTIALDGEVEAHLVSINGSPAIYFHPDEEDIKKMEKLPGIVRPQEYVYSQIRYEDEFDATLAYLQRYYTVAPGNVEYLEQFRSLFQTGRKRRFQASLIGSVQDIKEFWLRSKRMLTGKQIRVLAMVEDNEFYFVVDVTKAPAAKRLRNKVVPGLNARTKWLESDEMLVWQLPVGQPRTAIQKYVKELRARGVTISNLDELKEQYRQLKG